MAVQLDAVTIAIFLSAALLVFGLGLAMTPGGGADHKRLKARMQRLQRGPQHRSSAEEVAMASLRRARNVGVLGDLGKSFFAVLPRAEILRKKLDQAGIAMALTDFMLIWGVVALALGALLVLLYDLSILLAFLFVVFVVTSGPNMYLGQRIRRRNLKFIAAFPEAVELIVRGIKSGLPVTEAIRNVGQELQEPVGGVFRSISSNIQIGMTLDEALWNAAKKLELQEFKFFVISLAIQQETGGNLSEILQNLSGMIRRREQVKLKVRAMSSEARASAMIIGSLPFIMAVLIYFINSDYILTLFVDPRGWVLLGIGGGSLLLGIATIAKMVRFEI